MNYTHLSRDERYQIQALRIAGHSTTVLAQQLRRHRSSISRELARNSADERYIAEKAQRIATPRQSCRRNARQFEHKDWPLMRQYLLLDLSPQQVAGRLRLEKRLCISHSAIYTQLHQCGWDCPALRCGQRRRKSTAGTGVGQLAGRAGIEEGPAVVEVRTRIGDWEGDTIVSGAQGKAALVTLTERRARYTQACLGYKTPYEVFHRFKVTRLILGKGILCN